MAARPGTPQGCGASRASDRATAIRRRNSFGFFQIHVGSTMMKELIQMSEWFVEGFPDKNGQVRARRGGRVAARGADAARGTRQLDHDGFCNIFRLHRDTYTDRLVRIFDLDFSGQIGYREFVYGLSKFSSTSFETKVQFAFRLFDLDGNGTLDKYEMMTALRAATAIDFEKYNPNNSKRHPVAARPLSPSDNQLKREVNELCGRKEYISMVSFQVLASRYPQLFAPAKYLYDILHNFSAPAMRVMDRLGDAALIELFKTLNRQPNLDGAPFGDRDLRRWSVGEAVPAPDLGAGGESWSASVKKQREQREQRKLIRSRSLPEVNAFDALEEPPRLNTPSPNRSLMLSEMMEDHWERYSAGTPSPSPKEAKPKAKKRSVRFVEDDVAGGAPAKPVPKALKSSEVSGWLRKHGLEEYQGLFELGHIDSLATLKLLSDADLKELGLPKGPRLRIGNLLGKAVGEGPGGAVDRSCKICMVAHIDTVIRPCGHAVMCQPCANKLPVKECPICRRAIEETIRLFTA